MGWFGDILAGTPFGSDENSGGYLYDVFDPFDFSGKKAKNAAAGQYASQDELRRRNKKIQLDMLDQKKGPAWTPQQEARIKALEQESNLKLHEDPQFQTQMRMATGGGAQALSGIQNRQAASGATGGFSNQGSISDVYDRLGTQLAMLAQNQNQFAGQKRDAAAQARQSLADAQLAFENAKVDARMAIEQGDYQAVASAMDRLYAAQAQADAAMRQNVIAAGKMVAGAFTGNAPMAASGAGSMASAQPMQGGEYGGAAPQSVGQASGMYGEDPFGVKGNKPWYQTAGGFR